MNPLLDRALDLLTGLMVTGFAIGMAIVGYEVMKQKRQKREEQERRA